MFGCVSCLCNSSFSTSTRVGDHQYETVGNSIICTLFMASKSIFFSGSIQSQADHPRNNGRNHPTPHAIYVQRGPSAAIRRETGTMAREARTPRNGVPLSVAILALAAGSVYTFVQRDSSDTRETALRSRLTCFEQTADIRNSTRQFPVSG